MTWTRDRDSEIKASAEDTSLPLSLSKTESHYGCLLPQFSNVCQTPQLAGLVKSFP